MKYFLRKCEIRPFGRVKSPDGGEIFCLRQNVSENAARFDHMKNPLCAERIFLTAETDPGKRLKSIPGKICLC